ncbi:MAG: hypothetical protein GX600_01825, partial [Dehalococcoidia bacterium]|nr:hypothetical protein [Dehalococcoidia bacterium]
MHMRDALHRLTGSVLPQRPRATAVARLLLAVFTSCMLLPIMSCVPVIVDETPDSVLRLYDVGPITLDPAISGEMSSHIYVMHLYSGLVDLDEDLMVQPDIA